VVWSVADLPPREYGTQWKESELAFVSRLLEDEGLCYWFEHDDEGHAMHISDGQAEAEAMDGPPILIADERGDGGLLAVNRCSSASPFARANAHADNPLSRQSATTRRASGARQRPRGISSLAFDFLRMIRGILFPRAHACPGQTNCARADGHLREAGFGRARADSATACVSACSRVTITAGVRARL
jgi:hypothetical protein